MLVSSAVSGLIRDHVVIIIIKKRCGVKERNGKVSLLFFSNKNMGLFIDD